MAASTARRSIPRCFSSAAVQAGCATAVWDMSGQLIARASAKVATVDVRFMVVLLWQLRFYSDRFTAGSR
jgi:hypothetical protein